LALQAEGAVLEILDAPVDLSFLFYCMLNIIIMNANGNVGDFEGNSVFFASRAGTYKLLDLLCGVACSFVAIIKQIVKWKNAPPRGVSVNDVTVVACGTESL